MAPDYRELGLLPGEQPIETIWAGVIDPRRAGGSTVARAVGHVLLPAGLRRAVMPPDRSFLYTVTTTGVLVLSGVDVAPIRLDPGHYRLDDSGERRSMRTLVRGRLARVTLATANYGTLHLFLQEDSLRYLSEG